MNPSIWTPRYLFHRVRLAAFEYRNPDLPWLTADAISFLAAWLNVKDYVLEFGSGRSTVWLASRCQFVLSVEHDPVWFGMMSKKLADCGNVRYRLAELRSSIGSESPYLTVLNEVSDESCDVLLNDGRLRCQVAREGISKLRPGGLHVLDNAERYLPNDLTIPSSRGRAEPTADWAQFIAATADWRRVWTSNGVTATLLMFKPC